MKKRYEYPIEWYDTIRPNILKRDGYKCKKCNIGHRSWVAVGKGLGRKIIDSDDRHLWVEDGFRVYQIILQVSHNDNNKSNCHESNLESLCVSCHVKKDKYHKSLMRIGLLKSRQLDLEIEANKMAQPPSVASLPRSDNR